VYLIEKDFFKASVWALIAAVSSFFGLIHGYKILPGGVVPWIGVGAAWKFAVNYLLFSLIFLVMHGWERVRNPVGPSSSS